MKIRIKQNLLAFSLLVFSFSSFAQGTYSKTELVKGWHLLDKEKDGVYGISLDKAYEFLHAKNLKSKPVLVAVIDSGVDTLQEDLIHILWTNPGEIPGNGVDDDHNGYVDDIHGWNFIGGKDGTNVKDDSQEEGRVYYEYKDQFDNKNIRMDSLSNDARDHYEMWVKAKKKIMGDGSDNGVDLLMLKRVVNACIKSDSIMQAALGKKEYTGNDLDSFEAKNMESRTARSVLLYLFKENHIMDMTNTTFLSDFKEQADREEKKMEIKETAPKNYRGDVVKDNENDIKDSIYGNNDIMATDPMHGTHVSGIIGAERNNAIGINGIADNVRIMMVRAVPNGDEHDKDIALAIRYAVNNGARVINMSFGKNLSPQKTWVDDAVKYAESKGVLLIHAAGNDAEDVDSVDNFPNPDYKNSKFHAKNWITVGASSDPLAEENFKSYTASFSNYGKKEVDVFAPGTRIYSTLPGGNKYGNLDGTSMAAPVVTGVAALILEYFPNLSPEEVKYCIDKSAYQPATKAKKPGSENELVPLSELSASGGILNAYGAVKMASAMSEPRNQEILKSTLKKERN
ncbi:MAG TPA: peptidase S8 [Chitinophagaceae bacterium]|jgi:cell wall-associated protease|nr:peptidase S8 [Chitinophagaceae bacterium]